MRTDITDALSRRISESAQPSRLINQLHDVDQRCGASSRRLTLLMGRAPRCLGVIRAALREAFDLDPHTLLFTEPGAPGLGPHVSTLTERALGLLANPGIAINLHQYTQLSVKDQPERRLAYNARDALLRVKGLDLLVRLDRAVNDYWQQLAYGTWLTRAQQWADLSKSLFADKAFLAHQTGELTTQAYELVLLLIEAPSVDLRTRAGGDWAQVQVGTLLWPGTRQATLAIQGALHLYRRESGLQVIYLPGLEREFHVFDSWEALQCELPALLSRAGFENLWHCLPLRRRHEVCSFPEDVQPAVQRGQSWDGDALALNALAVREGQWDNELACALSINPGWVSFEAQARTVQLDITRYLAVVERARKRLSLAVRLGAVLNDLLAWDHRRRAPQLCLPSALGGLPLHTREQLVRRYENGLLALLKSDSANPPPEAYQRLLDQEALGRTHADTVRQMAHGPLERLLDKAYWLESGEGSRKRASQLLVAQCRALLCEVRIQHQLQLIDSAELQHCEQVLRLPVATQLGKLSVSVGSEGQPPQPLLGVLVMRAPASVLLWVTGRQGGLVKFDSLDALSAALTASLLSVDDSPLWHCIPRDMRQAARTQINAASWTVVYTAIEKHPMQHLFLALLEQYARLATKIAEPTPLFSEVSDPQLARLLLVDEFREQLAIPPNAALSQAIATVQLWRRAAHQANLQPTWLATASVAQRRHYKRLRTHYLAGALAFEDKLWQTLPDLETFARRRLTERLSQDGLYPEVDIDQPLLDMPDDVSKHFCGWSSLCVVGDRHVKTVVSAQRSTYSLVQLVLHNLDPQAPWTEWRLNRARYRMPAWQARLSPAYLIKTISELDIGGDYHALVQRTFYPASGRLIQALSERALEQQARLQLFLAIKEGLDAAGQSLFTTAMAAREPVDLLKNGHRIQVCCLRLVGYTMAHDRHIAGLLLFHDLESGQCVVYWPTGTWQPAIRQYPSLSAAREALNHQATSQVKHLAHQIAPGWEAQALASYPGMRPRQGSGTSLTFSPAQLIGFGVLSLRESIARFIRSFKVKHRMPVAALDAIEAHIHEQIAAAPAAWLAISPIAHSAPLVLLTHARQLEIQHRSHAFANSGALLATLREQRLDEQRNATLRGLLSFVPVIGVGISLYELVLVARRYHLSGDPHEAVDVAFMTLMAFFDVVTIWVPSAKGGTAARGLARASLRRLRPSSMLVRSSYPPLRSVLATPPKLMDRFKKVPLSPTSVKLRGPGNPSIHVDSGEQFLVADGHRYPLYRRREERHFRLKNREAADQDELILHIEEPGEWLLGADAPAPQPGPSSAIWQPWVVRPSTEWVTPSTAALELALPQLPLAAGGWQAWGFLREMTLMELSPTRGIFQVATRVGAPGFEVLRLGGQFYRLLPEGGETLSHNLVFITPNRRLAPLAFNDVADWLGVGLPNQPLAAVWSADGHWTIHRPLFTEPLETSLHLAFPNMTPASRRFLVSRLSERSDTHRSLTATRMLRLRATLDRWMAPQRLGRTDDLLRLLRPTESQAYLSMWIGQEGIAPGFGRVDFLPPETLSPLLQHATQLNRVGRYNASQRAIRLILEPQGFEVRIIAGQPGSRNAVHFVCTHPDSNNLYYVLSRWANDTTINLSSRQEVQLTDTWFHRRFTAKRSSAEYAPVKRAMEEQRLVKIIAGIQWTWMSEPTVFFARFDSVRPGAMKPRPRSRTRPR